MGSLKPSFNMHSAMTGGLGGSNGILKRPTLSNIILGGMQKQEAKDSTNTMNPGTSSIVGQVGNSASTDQDDKSSL